MSVLFHTEEFKHHFKAEFDKEDLLYAMQVPAALTALAALFFLH